MNNQNELLSRKELAAKLKRSRKYVYYMERRGFVFVAGRATIESALKWLVDNPQPCKFCK